MSFNLTTPFGIVAIKPTDNQHLYLELAPVSPDLDAQGHRYSLPFTLRGVSYHGGIHLYRWSDGNFTSVPNQDPATTSDKASTYVATTPPIHPTTARATLPSASSFKRSFRPQTSGQQPTHTLSTPLSKNASPALLLAFSNNAPTSCNNSTKLINESQNCNPALAAINFQPANFPQHCK